MRTAPKHAQIDNANWMITFSDLMTLLLTFFVLIFAMTTAPQSRVNQQTQNLDMRPDEHTVESAIDSATELGNQHTFASNRTTEQADKEAQPEAQQVRLGSDAFAFGESQLSFRATELVRSTAKSVSGRAVKIKVAVQVIEPLEFQQTFAHPGDLTSARVSAITSQLIDAGVEPSAISVVSHDNSIVPIIEHSGGKRHQNSRAEIIIHPRG